LKTDDFLNYLAKFVEQLFSKSHLDASETTICLPVAIYRQTIFQQMSQKSTEKIIRNQLFGQFYLILSKWSPKESNNQKSVNDLAAFIVTGSHH
jgi:hypothetical protein